MCISRFYSFDPFTLLLRINCKAVGKAACFILSPLLVIFCAPAGLHSTVNKINFCCLNLVCAYSYLCGWKYVANDAHIMSVLILLCQLSRPNFSITVKWNNYYNYRYVNCHANCMLVSLSPRIDIAC